MTAQRQQAIVESISRTADSGPHVTGDEFLGLEDLVPVKRNAAERTTRQAFAELLEFIRENKWEDAVNIFYPMEEKLPEVIEHGLDAEIRAKLAFVLGQINRFDNAIRELSLCVRGDANNFHLHSSLAYTAYNSLYAAANREIFLRGKIRAERIELAHRHFEKARELRPDGVTNFYREGMLFKQIEKKTEKALPLFQKAISNWDNLTEEQKQARHQEGGFREALGTLLTNWTYRCPAFWVPPTMNKYATYKTEGVEIFSQLPFCFLDFAYNSQ